MTFRIGEKIILYAPIVRGRKGEFKKVFEDAAGSGFVRVRVDGKLMRVEEASRLNLDKQRRHVIDIIVDRIVLKPESRPRIAESVETAGNLTEDLIGVIRENGDEELFSKRLACVSCGISYPEIQPRLFSFNSPYGACTECMGLGLKLEFDPNLIIPDKTLSFNEGAILTFQPRSSWARSSFDAFSKRFDITAEQPIGEIPEPIYRKLLYGTDEELRFIHDHSGVHERDSLSRL
jgi:excinuclease ABC subunit A